MLMLMCIWRAIWTMHLIGVKRLLIIYILDQQMSAVRVKQDKHLQNILIGAATLAALYAAFQYFTTHSSAAVKTCTLQHTNKVLKEIKYQICANCISFSEGVNTKLKAKYPEKELEVYLRTEMAKIYDSKEQLILTKYQLPKQQYGASLQKYSKNKEIIEGQKQIFDMLERAVKGNYPDFTVRPQAKNLYNNKQVLRVYYEMCEQIATKVWLKLQENRRQNPNFNSKDDAHFKKAIRDLSIYEFKAQFLQKKGYIRQWGCPNMTFFKIIESIKINSPEIKKQASFIEKSYEILIGRISTDPQQFDRRQINHEMEENFQKLKNPVQATKPMLELMKKPSVSVPVQSKNTQPFASVNKSSVQQLKKVQEQQFDLQKMMMNELLSRSIVELADQKPVVQPEPVVQIKVQQQKPVLPQKVQNEQESLLLPQQDKSQIKEQQSLLLSKDPEPIQVDIQQHQQHQPQQIKTVQVQPEVVSSENAVRPENPQEEEVVALNQENVQQNQVVQQIQTKVVQEIPQRQIQNLQVQPKVESPSNNAEQSQKVQEVFAQIHQKVQQNEVTQQAEQVNHAQNASQEQTNQEQ